MKTNKLQHYGLSLLTAGATLWGVTASVHAADAKKPNILIIMGDDIGLWNISAYNQGMMGYRTPNIDSIAKAGALFTDAYAQQSCTAGRAAFITGQSGFRTGLLKIGMPGGKEGISPKDPTLAQLLKPLGYMTGQFGKNHLGDRNEFLPTVHGFDEFYGNLYHLNAEEEPENSDYPTNAAFKAMFGPRGVIESFASTTDDPTVDGRNGPIGKQTVKDTGPLTKKRMETIDEEVTAKALSFIERAVKADKPFFCWYNTTRMHIWTHLKPESEGKTGLGIGADAMTEHDGMVGEVLNKLKELGIEDNTIVVYTTDNGAEVFSWPDGGMTPFRGEKNSNWEGGYRVPLLIKWPGVIPPGTQVNDIMSHEDFVPTLVAAAGDPDITAKLLTGYQVGDDTFKVHLDTPTPNPDDFKWELYHVAEDFSQSKNLAAENPAKLKEMEAIFDREAKKYNVYPLDSSFAERADTRLRPSLTRGINTFTYYPGTFRVPEGTAPDTKNKSWGITAEVEIPEGGAEGVLVTQGGRFGGYVLLIVDGKPEFDYAFSNQQQHKYRVTSPEKLAPGKHTIKVDMKYNGPGMGKSATGTLFVDGKQVAQGTIERTIPIRFSLDETFDVAEDTGTPVVEDYEPKMPFKFTGTLDKVVIELGKSGLVASDTKAVDSGDANAAAAGE